MEIGSLSASSMSLSSDLMTLKLSMSQELSANFKKFNIFKTEFHRTALAGLQLTNLKW